MLSHRRTCRAMQLSRGLLLGRILTQLYHLALGLCMMSAIGLTLTGNVATAVIVICGFYLACKACTYLWTLITRRPA